VLPTHQEEIVDFALSSRAEDFVKRLNEFMDSHVYPAERVYHEQRLALAAQDKVHHVPQVIEDLKAEARSRGLWNLFLPDVSGLSNVEYAHLAEITGRSSRIAPEAINCAAPDTGNMEVLHLFGTSTQKETWLTPLLEGEIRSAFAMTEPAVASSDATNISTEIRRDGDDYVINGRKWWISGAADPRCAVMIVMGKTNPEANTYQQQSMVLVPMDTAGVTVVRPLPVFGYQDQHGHCEITFQDVRVPASNLVGEEGGGFAIAQARLGPGRIHHCMRLLGIGERALEMMCRRSLERTAFGGPLAGQGVIADWIAESRVRLEQLRLLVLKAAWLMDTVGNKGAHTEIQAIKIAVPVGVEWILDKAIQVHGAGGVSQDFPLAGWWAAARSLRLADGPDEVHRRSLARRELAKYRTN
jgi:acyl-CoA dehydrogenase